MKIGNIAIRNNYVNNYIDCNFTYSQIEIVCQTHYMNFFISIRQTKW